MSRLTHSLADELQGGGSGAMACFADAETARRIAALAQARP